MLWSTAHAHQTLTASLVLAIGGMLLVAAPAWAHPVLHITASPTTVVAGSNTTITISGTSNGNYSGARIDVFSSGGPGTLPSFTTFVSCGGGPTCSEVGSVYRMALPTLTNGQAFSYTITLKIDVSTAATTFITKAQFYKSDNTTDGPTTGPVITVLAAADLQLLGSVTGADGAGGVYSSLDIFNAGPGDSSAYTVTVTVNRTGFGPLSTLQDNEGACPTSGQSGTCTETVPLPAANYDNVGEFFSPLNLLALGTYVITTTLASPTDPNTANNTVTDTCNVVTPLIVTCTFS